MIGRAPSGIRNAFLAPPATWSVSSNGKPRALSPTRAAAISRTTLARATLQSAHESTPEAMASSKNRGAIFQLREINEASKSEQIARESEESVPPKSTFVGELALPQRAAQQAASGFVVSSSWGNISARSPAACGPLNIHENLNNSRLVNLGSDAFVALLEIMNDGGGKGHPVSLETFALAGLKPCSPAKLGPHAPVPTIDLHAHCARGPEQYTSQEGERFAPPLPVSDATIMIVVRCGGTSKAVAPSGRARGHALLSS
mmetsp:Transcript_66702/g.105520  ORF Transcript_66702/g.105520 Transcript_66702/m.105520 type:complete len:259 (+) Transcript_66702:475-1251(+)